MKNFNYNEVCEEILNYNVVNLITKIYENKGKQNLFIEAKRDVLSSLLKVAKIQSTISSNNIEGIKTTNARAKNLVDGSVKPKTRDEQEILGYKKVLELIHENHDNIDISSGSILQLHKYLYDYSPSNIGGNFKTMDNAIEETNELGEKQIRFKPLSALETPEAIKKICEEYNEQIQLEKYSPLILSSIFIFDFLSIHPFVDGNGRMSRLLTLLLLYKSGYIVGKYISIEKIVETTKDSYYETLKNSSIYWKKNNSDYSHFVQYYLTVILKAYSELSDRIDYLSNKKLTAKDRILIAIERIGTRISKQEILDICPNISQSTVEKALAELVKSADILKINGGRYTKYCINIEKN